MPEFAPTAIAETRRRHEQAGLQIACLSSSATVVAAIASEEERRQSQAHVAHYIDMATAVGAAFVRLFCGDVPAHLPREEALDRAAQDLRAAGDYAQARGITLVVETHDAFTRSADLMELIRLAHHPAVQVLWDIHNPYQMAGESIAQMMHTLRGYVRYTHVKDSLQHTEGDGHVYVPVGDGDVPVRDAIKALRADGYDGFLTLEWEKRWIANLAPPEVIFPHYQRTVRAWLG